MKASMVLYALVTIQLLFQVSCVYFLEHQSDKKTSTKSYKDLLDLAVYCPHNGVLKNFRVDYDASNVWYDFSCYSSFSDANENDESVLKSTGLDQSKTFKTTLGDSISSLGSLDIVCPVDYALNKFVLTKNGNSNLVVDYKCVGVKSSSQTKANTLTSESQNGDGKSLDALKGLICGDTTAETEEVPGNPLKGFKIIVSGNKITYGYSTHRLRSIEKERLSWGEKAKTLRNSNTQKN